MFFNCWIFLVLDSIRSSIENTSSTAQYPGATVTIYIRNKQHAEAEKTGILTEWFVAGALLKQNPLLSASWSSCYCALWCHHLTSDDTMVYYLSCIHSPMLQRAGDWENAGIPSDTRVKQETTLSSSSTEEVLEAPWEIPRSQPGCCASGMHSLPQSRRTDDRPRGNGWQVARDEPLHVAVKWSPVPLERRM